MSDSTTARLAHIRGRLAAGDRTAVEVSGYADELLGTADKLSDERDRLQSDVGRVRSMYKASTARENDLIEERDCLRSALRGIATHLRHGRASDADLLGLIRRIITEEAGL